jgi:hypothetical protein
MCPRISLKEASNCLYEHLMKNMRSDIFVRVLVTNQTIDVHDSGSRQLICSFDHAEISSHMLLAERRGKPLSDLVFPADDIRRLLNSHQNIDDYFEKDILYLEETIEHYTRRLSRPGFPHTAYFIVKFVRDVNCYMLCMYQKRLGVMSIPNQDAVPGKEFWAHFAKVHSYTFLTPESAHKLRSYFGTKLIAYENGMLRSAVRLSKLKMLLQP